MLRAARSSRVVPHLSFPAVVRLLLPAAALALLLVSCGGGGGSSLSSGGSGGVAAQIAACQQGLPALQTGLASNVASVVVDSGPCGVCPSGSKYCTAGNVVSVNAVNIPYTSVTICVPGSTTACQTIDHIMVDTGSSGLRIMSSVLSSSLALPAVSYGSSPLRECVQFADGYSWGSVHLADVKVAGETASGISVQIIGDSSSSSVPSACTSGFPTTPTALNDVVSFGSNGVLGVGLFAQDCGTGCTASGNPIYHACTGSACAASTGVGIPLNQQVTNPVAAFAADNTGVILQMGSVTNPTGARNIYGTLVFGINTGPANTLLSAPASGVYRADYNANFDATLTQATSSLAGYVIPANTFSSSFIDSGSNGLYLPLPSTGSIPTTTDGWFAPSTLDTLGVTVQGHDPNTNLAIGPTGNFSISIANADASLFTTTNNAFNNLGAPSLGSGTTGGVDFGLPFFYGKPVYVAIEKVNLTVGGTVYTGPFWAF